MKIIGLYLGAGNSSRMGKNKLELPFRNHFLGSNGFQAALDSKLDVTFAVTNKEDRLRWLVPFSKRKGWSYIRCHDEISAQSASLKTGLKKAIDWGADAIVVLLADQPFVTSGCINQLVGEFFENPEVPYVSASQNGIMKPPVLFAKSAFPALFKLKGDEGARVLLRGEWSQKGKEVVIFDDHHFVDVDTLEDYQSIIKEGWLE